MLPTSENDVLNTMHQHVEQKPVAMYEIPQQMLDQDISRAQLQRLMDEDQTMPLLLGSAKAVDVIRRFRKGTQTEEETAPVTALQGTIFGRIDNLEKVQLDEDVPDVLEIKEITE